MKIRRITIWLKLLLTVLLLHGCSNAGRISALDYIQGRYRYYDSYSEIPIIAKEAGSIRIYRLFSGTDPAEPVGYFIEQQVVSRSGPFTVATIVDNNLAIKHTQPVNYPHRRGRGVSSSEFTGQFIGKSPGDRLEFGKDVHGVTAATISCKVMTGGLRKALQILSKI